MYVYIYIYIYALAIRIITWQSKCISELFLDEVALNETVTFVLGMRACARRHSHVAN